jgi:hypothetical protein
MMKVYYACPLTKLLCVVAVMAAFAASAGAQQIQPPFREDLVGTLLAEFPGGGIVFIDGEMQNVDIKDAAIILRNDDFDCRPQTRAGDPNICPLTLEMLSIDAGGFKFRDTQAQGVHIRNQGAVPQLRDMGVAGGFPFDVRVDIGDSVLYAPLQLAENTTTSTTYITYANQPGDRITLQATFTGRVEDSDVRLLVLINFATINHQPIASGRGSALTVRGNSDCIVLDASDTTDPDGNLLSLEWYDENGIFVGTGRVVGFTVHETGRHRFLLVARDDLMAESRADVYVDVFTLTGRCADINRDGNLDRDDLNILLQDLGKSVSQSACGAPCDLNGDGYITNLDAHQLIQMCSRPQCATQ